MRKLPASLLVVCLAASSAWAVKTQYFTHTTRDDFGKGTASGVVVTNHGQLKLARKLESLLPDDRQFDAIQAVVQTKDGAIVFGTFPDGEVLRLKDGKLETLATFADRTITAMAIDGNDRIHVALAGESAEVMLLAEKAGEKPASVFKLPGIDYVWSIVPSADRLLLGTGPNAQVISVQGKKSTQIADLAGNNVLSLMVAPDGTAYAGTDELGLVYRIDVQNQKAFVLFDAAEAEISALAIDPQGNLLAATSETRERVETAPAQEKPAAGNPEKQPDADAIDAAPPVAPKRPHAATTNPIPRDAPAEPQGVDDNDAAKPADEKVIGSAGPKQPAANAEGQAAEGARAGNAVYRIDKAGFVTEVYRGETIIYSMATTESSVLLGTGDVGEIHEVRPDSEEATVVALASGAEQVTALLPTKDGSLLCATSNNGGILRLSHGYSNQGTYTSEPLDAAVTSTFGTLQLRGTLPEKTGLSIQTRSGNIADPDEGGWSDWSAATPAKEFNTIATPTARYVQYRLELSTTDPAQSPAVDEVMLAYQKPNLAPRVASIAVVPAQDPQNPGNMNVTWEASDPNEDALKYALFVRAARRGTWMKLADDLADNTFVWAGKQVADGQYELKVVASDARANPEGQGREVARVSNGVLIDNTPPTIGDAKVDGTTVTLRVVDRAGTVASLEYAVDSTTHWQKSLPDDTMADSPEERYTIALKGLAKGQHTLTVRATDDRGNAGHETISVNVP